MTTTSPIHVCHAFATFAPGGPQVRTASIINAVGSRFRHTIVALDNRFDAAEFVDAAPLVQYVAPPRGKGSLAYPFACRRLLETVRPDLLVTYNWGAMDMLIGGQLARRCPIVHTEDGFGPDEIERLKIRRVWTRRVALRGTFSTVVPSRTLFEIAVRQYRLPPERVLLVPNGVDGRKFNEGLGRSAREQIGVPTDSLVIGTVGGLRAEKNLRLLIEAFAQMRTPNVRLVVVGDGPERAELKERAVSCRVADRVVFTGHQVDTSRWYAAFDVFALSSTTEQLPIALLDGMAAGLPCVCTDVGDCRDALAGLDGVEIVRAGSGPDLARALDGLCANRDLRKTLGTKNRARWAANFTLDRMVRAYERIYLEAVAASS